MGTLHYDGTAFEFNDRVLAHLQIVVNMKLRRRETFFLSWKARVGSGGGRHAIWVDNGIPIHFEYSGGRLPIIDKGWVDRISLGSNSTGGVFIDTESEGLEATPVLGREQYR